MTYGQLLMHLNKLSPQQLNQSVTVYRADTYPGDEDEYIPVRSVGVVDLDLTNDGLLEEDHIVLNTGGE